MQYQRYIQVALVLAYAVLCFGQPEGDQPSRPRRSARSRQQTTDTEKKTATTDTATTPTVAAASVSLPLHLGAMSRVDEYANIAEAVRTAQQVDKTDLKIGYFITAAEPFYRYQAGTLAWTEPGPSDNYYLGVTVQDAADGRLIPECKVSVSFTDAKGKDALSTRPLGFIWDPKFNHYGGNIQVPRDPGELSLNVKVEPPGFLRRDKKLGAFFSEVVTTSWPSVTFPEARASAGPEKPKADIDKAIFPAGRYPAIEPTPYPGADGTTPPAASPKSGKK
ncbi:MAG: hypothetical protein K1X53_09145 [Candidatus Sumerlaeaceae bacterium]|nr:hypothetical protein [Candidatus Sumerlaeaceae bacterium]